MRWYCGMSAGWSGRTAGLARGLMRRIIAGLAPGLARRLTAIMLVAGLVVALAVPVFAQDEAKPVAEKKIVHAIRINPHAPKLDGRLDDAIWERATFATDFVQKEPTQGDPAKNRTRVAFAFDDEALYIGAYMSSDDPQGILSTVSRRDNTSNSERIVVSLDTYHNRRTAYSFGVTASGVRTDYYHRSDHEYNRDYGYDPVWQAKAARTEDGWSAEMRIPFTQLRFNKGSEQTWGVNINRWVPTNNEDSYWVLVAKDDTGWSSRMGEIHGIAGIMPSRRIELMPYAASDGRFTSGVARNDPFHSDKDFDGRFGGDFRMGVGPNLTLEGTVNPDFGQVEADPAEVNLSAFETFFSERRPFFTEGSELLSGGGAGYFYSRRVGGSPHHFPAPEVGDDQSLFVDQPTNSSILGAAKLTGRLKNGLSIGVLGAVTAKEQAEVALTEADGTISKRFEEMVEPRTGFGVVRLQQEFGQDASTVGAILTGVERDLDRGSALTDILRKRAISGGSDFNLRFAGGKYVIRGNGGFSYIEGSPAAIEAAQRSSARYFQRPDNDYADFDPSRTSLKGWTSGLRFEKNSGKHWLFGGGTGVESPGFEINDAGRLGTSDDIDSWAWLRYRENEPGKLFQNYSMNARLGSGWNFGGDRQYAFIDLESWANFKSFNGGFLGFEYFPASQSDNLTRGGPSMGTGANWNIWNEWWSHNKGRVNGSGFVGYSQGELHNWSYNVGGSVTVRPGSRWQVSLRPRWNQRTSARQFIGQFDGGNTATFGQRYVFSFIERSTLSAQLRLNYAFTPDLTLELYAEPFTSSGRYFGFGELTAARSRNVRHYGQDGPSTIVEKSDGVYEVSDGSDTFEIEQADFNFLSYRSNLVLRWEWNPGSTLFVVWQQNRSDGDGSGRLARPGSLLDAFSAEGDNFVAIKITYWIPFL